MYKITDSVTDDEKAWGLFERDFKSPDEKSLRRWEIIQVNRDGDMAEYRRDMGEANLFRGINQVRIPSFWEHTVAELRGMALYMKFSTIDVKDFLELDRVNMR